MNPSPPVETTSESHVGALIVLTSLFFMWGLITSLNDILIPHLKEIFTLSYVQAMLIQFCFFGAYLVMSFPSGYLTEKLGYRRGIIIGLSIAGCGCALFYPASNLRSYALFLTALFVLASGIALLQVAANPYVAALGPAKTSSSRLNLTQAFNSLGTTLGPYLGSVFILSASLLTAEQLATLSPAALDAHVRAQAQAVQGPYLLLAMALFVIALLFSRFRLPSVTGETPSDIPPNSERSSRSVWSYRHLVLGALAIFVYVGAEVAIGSLMVSFLERPEIGGLSAQTAGRYLSLYWGGAMLGRFVGSVIMRKISPARVLAFNAVAASVLLVLAITVGGKVAMWSVLSIGLCNSIMFPTIFTLAIARLGPHTGEGSGVLCMAIFGGALIPLLQGAIADHAGVVVSYATPILCYMYIVYYGLRGHRPVNV